jgi:hypothetical protein
MHSLNQNNTHFSITSRRLKADIAIPGQVYRRSRFDWTGFISQVTLDGHQRFCTKESFDPQEGTGGEGLCNEFGTIGYDECALGEFFPKLGIGNLKRNREEYSFRRQYDTSPYAIHMDIYDHQVVLNNEPLECNGYAARLSKVITVHENQLIIDYQLENVGNKPIITTEYCHNFLCIGNHTIGPEYRLTLPYHPELNILRGKVAISDNHVFWEDVPEEVFYCMITGYAADIPHQWTLTHIPSGAQVSEFTQAPIKFALWGLSHVVSPEIFISVQVHPGGTQKWSRKFEFEV